MDWFFTCVTSSVAANGLSPPRAHHEVGLKLLLCDSVNPPLFPLLRPEIDQMLLNRNSNQVQSARLMDRDDGVVLQEHLEGTTLANPGLNKSFAATYGFFKKVLLSLGPAIKE